MARDLARASLSPHTRRAYAGALRRLAAWLASRDLDDRRLAPTSPSCSRWAVRRGSPAIRIRPGRPPGACWPASAGGARTAAAGRLSPARPRRAGRGLESAARAEARAAVDRVIAGLLFIGGLRRSEAAALEWRDVTDAREGDGLLVAVRRSKTNPDGETADVRFVKGDVASAVRALRERRGAVDPTDRVVGLSAQAISERFAAPARADGIEPRLTAHSGRVELAAELTARGASAHDGMRAGNWKTGRMVAHYSAGASAERGAVARYL